MEIIPYSRRVPQAVSGKTAAPFREKSAVRPGRPDRRIDKSRNYRIMKA